MKQQIEVMDERQKQISLQALAYGGIFLLVCLVAAMIYDIATTGDVGWELWAILGECLVIIISRRLLGDVEQPKDVMGRPLPVGSSKQDKMARRKDYAIQSVIFALACTVMDILLVSFGREDVTDYELAVTLFPSLSKGMTIALTAAIAFVTMFVISYTCDYLVGEKIKVKKYNQMLAALDEEDE